MFPGDLFSNPLLLNLRGFVWFILLWLNLLRRQRWMGFSASRLSLFFVHLAIRPGVPAKLPRPEIMPADAAARFRRLLAQGGEAAGQLAVAGA